MSSHRSLRDAAHRQITESRTVHEMRGRAGYEETKSDGGFNDTLNDLLHMSMLDVGEVSREVQLAVDLIIQYHGFQGSTSMVAGIYHAINKDWGLFIFAMGWGIACLCACAGAYLRVRWAERILFWSMVATLIEANVSVMTGIAPQGYLSVSMWAAAILCLVIPTKGNIIVIHLVLLLTTLNYYLGLTTDTLSKHNENTVNLVWRAGVSCWGYLVLVILMVNVLKPIRTRLLHRRRVARERRKMERPAAAAPPARGEEEESVSSKHSEPALPPQPMTPEDTETKKTKKKKKKSVLGIFSKSSKGKVEPTE